MNALEMHIDVNLLSQKIASNVNRKFDPAEIDWILNREVGRFIKDRIKTDKDSLGFEATEIDMDAIRTLVVNDITLPLRKKAVNDRSVFAWLPGDYSYLIDDYSQVISSCDRADYVAANIFSVVDEYIYSYPVVQSSLDLGPFYSNLLIVLDNEAILEIDNGPGLPTKEELFTFIDKIMNDLWSLEDGSLTWYWERYGDFYQQGCILAVTTQEKLGSNTIIIDGTDTDAIETFKPYLTAPVITSSSIKDPVPNRIIKGQARSQVLNSTFAGSRASSPISTLDGNLHRVYHDKRFIVNSLMISYVRKPRKISLSLSSDCDLPEEFHSQIVDRAVLFIKELTNNPDWQVKLQDMMLNKD